MAQINLSTEQNQTYIDYLPRGGVEIGVYRCKLLYIDKQQGPTI